MAGTVRTATTGPIAQSANRTCGILNDNATFWCIVEDNGVLYLYTSTDRVNFTLRNTITPAHALTASGHWSCGQAANNDLAIVYIPNATAGWIIYFYRLTYAAGPTWTLGAEEVVANYSAGSPYAQETMQWMGKPDVAFAAGSVPIVGFAASSTYAPTPSYTDFWALFVKKTSTNTWAQATYLAGIAWPSNASGKQTSFSMCPEYLTAVPGSNLVFVAITLKDPTNTTTTYNMVEDQVHVVQINVSTGAQPYGAGPVLVDTTGGNIGGGGSMTTARTWQVYSPGPACFDVFCVVGNGASSSIKVFRFQPKVGSNPAYQLDGPYTLATINQDAQATSGSNLLWDRIGFMYLPIGDAGMSAGFGVLYRYTTGGYTNTRASLGRITGLTPATISVLGANGIYANRYWRPGASTTHPWTDDNSQRQYSMVSWQPPRPAGSRWVIGLSYNTTSKNYLMQENVQNPVTQNSPANGGTVGTDLPALTAQASLGATIPPQQQPSRIEYNLAKDTGYTTSLKDLFSGTTGAYTEQVGWLDPATGATATYTLTVPSGSALNQGTWYWKTRSQDVFGQYGTWSSDFTLIDSHPPSATPKTPTSDITYDFGASGTISFTWQYTDTSPNSTQSAYQVVVSDNTTLATVVDSGKVTLAGNQGVDISANLNIPSANKDAQLRWTVTVWDNENIAGPVSAASLFRVSDKPTVTLTSPTAAQVVATASPTIQWTFAASGGRTQAKYRILIINTDTGATTLDTGYVNSSATSYTPSQPLLVNSSSYSVQVFVVDSRGLGNQTTVVNFTTSWTPPTAPSFTVDPSLYENSGYVKITWTNSVKDATWTSWRVYRRITGSTGLPTLLAEYTVDQPNYEYDDYFAGSNVSYDYAVVQAADRFGSTIESAYNYTTQVPTGSHYWLIGIDVLTNTSAIKFKLSRVTGDSFGEEYEKAEMQIIGRGRRVDYGTRFGYKGSITAQLRDDSTSTARAKRLQLESVKAAKTAIYLRNPFGDIWLVDLDDLQMQHIAGVGTNEFIDVTVPYSEVS